MEEAQINAITERIIAAALRVRKQLGLGFLEKVYENSVALELRIDGFEVEQQKAIAVLYREHVVGEYFADMVVAGCVIVELKAARGIDQVYVAQTLNYLRATGLPAALLLNFGPQKLEIKRLVGSRFAEDGRMQITSESL
jgi:GxxExxY protein